MIPSLLDVREISPFEFLKLFYPPAEARSGPSQASKLELF